MALFGIGFRIALVVLAVVVERIGALWREHPAVGALRDHPVVASLLDHPLVRRFTASPPEHFGDDPPRD